MSIERFGESADSVTPLEQFANVIIASNGSWLDSEASNAE